MRGIQKLIITALILTGCQPSITTTSEPVDNFLVTMTPSKAFLQRPTQAAEEYPRGSGRLDPTVTPSPIVPTRTSTPDITFIELPDWVKNPENNLLLFTYDEYTTRSYQIGFFNPKDGEKFIVRLPFQIYDYYWKDANHIIFVEGYCNEPPERVVGLDISQGILRPTDERDFPETIRSCYAFDDPDKPIIRVNAEMQEPTVEIIDPSSDHWLRLTDLNDGISDIYFAVSPNQDYIAVVQIQGKYEFPEMWQPLFGTQVSIYHLPDRKLLATFAEEQSISNELLFTDNENVIYVRENTPCVISILSLSKKCIHAISDRFPNTTIVLGDPLKDRTKFGFLYFEFYPHQGGFCFYDLFSGDINCPTDQFSSLKGQIIVNYSFSPDNRYVFLEHDYKGCPSPWCDYVGDPKLAVLDLQANKLHTLGSASTYWVMDIFRLAKPWRPLP